MDFLADHSQIDSFVECTLPSVFEQLYLQSLYLQSRPSQVFKLSGIALEVE